jgi:hypothetical protein
MRSYIFTESERRRLHAWIEGDIEDDTTRMIFVSMRRDFQGLLADIELMVKVMRRLRSEGRWTGRSYMPRDLRKKMSEARSAASPS